MSVNLLQTPAGIRIAWRNITTTKRETARELLQEILAPNFGRVRIQQRCPHCNSSIHGPVRVQTRTGTPPLISISYAGDLAFVGIAPLSANAFGIDAEQDNEQTALAVSEALANAGTRASIRYWTRIEALAKARGTGLRGNWQHPDTTGFKFFETSLATTKTRTLITAALHEPS